MVERLRARCSHPGCRPDRPLSLRGDPAFFCSAGCMCWTQVTHMLCDNGGGHVLLSTLLLPTGACLQAELSLSFITGKSPQGQRSKKQRLRYGRRNIHLSIVPCPGADYTATSYRAAPVPGFWGPGPPSDCLAGPSPEIWPHTLVGNQPQTRAPSWITCHSRIDRIVKIDQNLPPRLIPAQSTWGNHEQTLPLGLRTATPTPADEAMVGGRKLVVAESLLGSLF